MLPFSVLNKILAIKWINNYIIKNRMPSSHKYNLMYLRIYIARISVHYWEM